MGKSELKRPIGVSVLAVFNIGLGLYNLFFTLYYGLTGLFQFEIWGGLIVLSWIFLLVSMVALVLGWGFWKGRGWAHTLGIFVYGILILSYARSLVEGELRGVVAIFVILALLYLFKSDVRRWFGQ